MTETPRPAEQPLNRVRRRDRAVEDEAWIRSYLRQAPYGVLATEAKGQPFATPLNFAYDEASNSLCFHASPAGRLHANIVGNARVCFCASEMGRVMAAGAASGFDVEYASVVVYGRIRVLEDAVEATHALRLLLDKYAPGLRYGEDYKAITPEALARTAVYRLEIDAWSAKRNPLEPASPA
jgi:nitroimidazol reductase NimA-like FMN-containing flavoprotein (pyridoxamine 5'-phosphate oxidase superfamily)